MSQSTQRRTILMADDDGEDCVLAGDALRATGRACDIHFVRNGEELFDYLRHRGEYAQRHGALRPDLILLDLKMPSKDGRETLRELKSDPLWRPIPVIMLTTSTARGDVRSCYDMGVNAYVAKPATFREWIEILDTITKYWFDVVQLAPKTSHGGKTH
jgi:CheY-like chemotaxis protein